MKKIKFPLIGLLMASLLTIAFFACKKDALSPTVTSNASKPGVISTPTVSCVSSTKHTITIRITAGVTGLPAGFSVQWKVGNNASDKNFIATCDASFSGVPGCSQYNVPPGESITVTIGGLSDLECGVSGGCGILDCGTAYEFRAFGHNDPVSGLGRSAFSNIQVCSTLACDQEGCETETAWGGNTGTNVGTPGAWFYIYDASVGGVQTLWAGQYSNAGTVEYSGGNIIITLAEGWSLNPTATEPVKIQGYNIAPTSHPTPGLFTTYKGSDLIVPVDPFAYYAIHVDVQLCK